MSGIKEIVGKMKKEAYIFSKLHLSFPQMSTLYDIFHTVHHFI
jgi:hypothetical protein